jgi:hypothetical protein
LDYFSYLEKSGLLLPTAGDEALPQGSWCFSDSLPADGSGLKVGQVWGHMNAEEFNDVSPEMFQEFIIGPYSRLAACFGALSFGCCEAVHRFWEDSIERLPNLKKLSVSAWCDQEMIGERLSGKDIVFHRKPTANLLGVGNSLDEDAVRAHFTRTATAARGLRLEIAQRDVYRIGAGPEKVRRYVELIRECIEKSWKP